MTREKEILLKMAKKALSDDVVQGDGRNNIKRYPNCQMRTSLGNCDAIGGFCTSINAPICDAFHKLSEAIQGWILCNDRLPEDIRPVLVTWKNNDPASYYQYIVGKHYIGTAHYYRGKWYWYSSVTEDLLAEYGKCDTEEFDEAIEAVAWMPLPEPYKGGDDE